MRHALKGEEAWDEQDAKGGAWLPSHSEGTCTLEKTLSTGDFGGPAAEGAGSRRTVGHKHRGGFPAGGTDVQRVL